MLLNNKKMLTMTAALMVLLLILFTGCVPQEENGSIKVSFQDAEARTLTPAISLDPASYTVSGNGPYDSSFTETTSDSPLQVSYLDAGEWIITVDAFNASGTRIATGTNSVSVTAGDTATLHILLLPPAGTGSLQVDVFWDDTVVANPVIESQLIASSGATLPLAANQVEAGHSEISESTLSTGYYTFSLQLLDAGEVVAGAVEAVRVLDGELTSGQYTFNEFNMPDGDVEIIIDPDLQEPLNITLSGTVASYVYGNTMTVTADAGSVTDVNYTWYLNGVSQGTGSSYTTASTLAPGQYRLDVVGFTTDGSQAGSTTHTFTVTES